MKNSMINWEEDWDNNDNSFWVGASPYCTDVDGPADIYWRLRQMLFGNKIEWYTDHDYELGQRGEAWSTIEEAKAAIQKQHDEIILSEYDDVE